MRISDGSSDVCSSGLACGFAIPAAADVPESTDPIKIALFDWTSVNINANILCTILTELGYNVEYVTADYLSSLTTGLTTGDITIGMEFWDTTAGEAMAASDAPGQTERLSQLGAQQIEAWVYPVYRKAKCPGMPTWAALTVPTFAAASPTPHPRHN